MRKVLRVPSKIKGVLLENYSYFPMSSEMDVVFAGVVSQGAGVALQKVFSCKKCEEKSEMKTPLADEPREEKVFVYFN